MKNRNITRILVLALALVMLFAVVACDNGGETEATGEATTTAAAATTTKAATTTAKKTTVKATTTAGATTTAATTTVGKQSLSTVSKFDGNNDGTNETYTFYNYLPEQFAAADAVVIKGGDHLTTDICVSPLEQSYSDGTKITHYYLNNNEQKDENGNVIPDANKILSWKVNIPADGVYEFCFNMRMKDDKQRGNIIQIDDGAKFKMDFQFSTADVAKIKDQYENTYMVGYSAELTKGEHLIKMTINTECPKTFHFRNIYLAKKGEVVVPVDVKLPATAFSTTLPAAYANALRVPGSACEAGATIVANSKNANRWDMTTVPATLNAASANGAIKLRGTESPKTATDDIFHYYLDKNVDADKNIDNCYITWKFNIAEAGTYTVVSYHRLKGDDRGGLISIDGGKVLLNFSYTASTLETETREGYSGAVPKLTDDYAGAYLTWEGVELELAAGEHTITYTQGSFAKSIHWRDFYFLKKAA